MKLQDKTVLITGASSGIGKACAEAFAPHVKRLIIAARRMERLHELEKNLQSNSGLEIICLELDVRDADQVKEKIGQLKYPVDILINNAGLALTSDKVHEASVENWDTMIDTNIKGLLYMTRTVLPGMIARNSGHIINIGSIAGHGTYPGGNVYSATKHAVRAISQSIRLDLKGTAIRVSEVAPGAVETEFSEVRWNDKQKAKDFYKGFQPLVAEDVADAVLYCATRPLHVNVSEVVLMPQAQASLTDISKTT